MTQTAHAPAEPRRRRIVRSLASLGAVLVGLALLGAGLAALGTRLGWWGYQGGLGLLAGAVGVGALGVLGSLVALAGAGLQRRGRLALGAAAAAVAGLAMLAVPLSQLPQATSVPRIHDITTDTENPPRFDALADARRAAPNDRAYPGAATAEKQAQAYPFVRPLVIDRPPQAVYEAALAEAREQGWRIAAAEPATGRIEATARTFWFGFRDDVAIRVSRTPDSGSVVDMRSASRVGESDLGVNAARIYGFLKDLEARLKD